MYAQAKSRRGLSPGMREEGYVVDLEKRSLAVGEAQQARAKHLAHAGTAGKSRGEICWVILLAVGWLVEELADGVVSFK